MATLSVKDIISSAIGATNVTTDESGNASYGSWSPNSVRSLIVSSNFVMVEWFPGSSMAKARKGRFTIKEIKAPLGYFDGENRPDPISPVLKKYGYRNIEEIIVDSKYGCTASSLAGIQLKGATNANAQPSSTSKYADAATVNADSSSKVSETAGWGTIRGNMGNTRLRSVTVINFPELANPMQFLDQLSKYRSQCDSGQTDGVNSLTSVLVREGLPVVDAVSLYAENDNTYLNCFTLSPSRYDADSKDKGLCKYLMDSANVSENAAAGSEDSDGEGGAEDSFDESLFHTILKESAKALDAAEEYAKSDNKIAIPDKLQSIIKLLKFVTSHKKGATPPDDMQIPSMSLPLEGHGVFCMDDQKKVSMVKQCSVELFGGAPSNKGFDDKSLASWYEGIVGRIKHDYPGLFDGSILEVDSDSSDEDNNGSFDETKFYSMLKALAAAKERVEEDTEIDEYEQSGLLTALGMFTAHNEGMSLPAELPIDSDEEDLGGSGVFGMDSDSKLEGFSDAVADLIGGCDDIPEDRSDSSLLKWYDSAAKGLYREYPQYFQSKKASEEAEDSKEGFDEIFYPVISQAVAAAKASTGINAGSLPKYARVLDNSDPDHPTTVKDVLLKLFAGISSHVKGQSIPDKFKNASGAITLPDDGSDRNWHGAFFMDSEYKVNEVKTLYNMLKGNGAPDVQFPALPVTDETKDALKAAYQGILDALSQEYPAAFGEEESGIEDIIYDKLRLTIDTKIEVVLKSYDSIFAAGYDLERPYSILGRGDIQYSPLQGGIIGTQKKSDLERVVVYLWNNISGYMDIVPEQISPTRDYKKVAEAPAGTYMPMLMAAMAYGYYLHDPDKDGREPGPARDEGNHVIHDWSKYRDGVVRPFLKKVFMRVAVNAANKIGATDVNSIAAHSLDITNAMDPVMDNLQKCILVSNLKISKSPESTKFVSMKVKVLAPESADEDSKVESIREGVLLAVAEATDKEIKTKGKTIAEHDGRYIEITFVADQVQDNVFPLFAYKALDALHEQNKEFNPGINSVLLGKDSNGRLLKAGERINFNNTFTHYILAKSRAGKGVMTLNILTGCMDGVTPLAYADNKPDMLSLLRSINPNVYGINGEAVSSGGGNDLFNQFKNIDSEVNWDNVPEYLDGFIGRDYKGAGNIFYMRFMLLTLGIILARVDTPQFRDILGGKHGITVVFDEFANTTTTFKNMCASWNTKLAPKNQIKAVTDELDKGKSLEEAMNDKGRELNPGMFWATSYLESIIDSVVYLKKKSDASLNADKMYDNIFVLGQHAIDVDKVRKFSKPNIYPANARASVRGLNDDVAETMITGLTRAGDADAFLGASESGDDFLCASKDKAEKANTYLNEKARGFAYVENIGAANELYKLDGSASDTDKIAFSNKQLYFKPFLLLEESEMEKYPVSNMLTFMRKVVSEQDIQDFVALNSAENNPKALNDGVSFLGYLDKAHISREKVSNQLQKTADMANWVVQKGLGYPGTWKDFVYDLRPQWIFSAKNISDALSKSSNAADMSASAEWFNSDDRLKLEDGSDSMLKTMRKLYPDYMPDFSNEDSKDYMGNLSDLEAGFGNSVGEDYNSEDTTSEDSAPTQVIPPVQPAAFNTDQQPVGIPVNPFDNMEMPVAADTTPVDEMQLVTSAIINKFAVTQGGALEANLRGIKIGGQPLQVNGVAQPQDKVNWAELLRKGYVAELDTTSNYINQYIAPAMGWGKCSVDTFFKESPALGILTVDGKQYSRMEATQPQPTQSASQPMQPVAASWQDPKSALNSNSMGSWFNRPNSGATEGQRGAAADLFQAGINRGKESFRNGGAVRKGAAAALGVAGLGLMTGGASTALLCSLAVWPPAWGLVGVIAAVRMFRGGRRRNY